MQRYSDHPCWSTSQARAIYGFAPAYRITIEDGFLETAEKVLDYFMKNLHQDFVLFLDFNESEIPNTVKTLCSRNCMFRNPNFIQSACME